MKPLVTFSVAILCALPLAAADQKAAAPATNGQQTATAQPATDTAATVQLSSQAGATQDSPLVAAAKRNQRARKKTAIVITNDTLGGKNARVTTTATAPGNPYIPPPAPGTDWATMETLQVAAQNRAKIEKQEAEKKRAADEAARNRRMAAAAAASEDDYLSNMDPAQLEHDLETQGSKTQPPTPQPQPATPPQQP